MSSPKVDWAPMPVTTSFVCAGKKHGEGYVTPRHPTKSLGEWGSVVSFPSGVRDRAPAENGLYAYFMSERSHLEHPFQYFCTMAGPPNVAGPWKTFPAFLFSTGLHACGNLSRWHHHHCDDWRPGGGCCLLNRVLFLVWKCGEDLKICGFLCCHIWSWLLVNSKKTRLNAFARSWFYNTTAVAVQYRTSIN